MMFVFVQGKVTVVTSLASELQSWAALVDHPSCQLTTIDIRYDSEYHAGITIYPSLFIFYNSLDMFIFVP